MRARSPALTRRDALAVFLAAWATTATGAPDEPRADDARWRNLRRALFGERPIADGDAGVIVLEAPERAADGAVVPIAIRARFDQSPARFIRQVTLVIDNNPSPVAAVLRYTPDSGRAGIETRVRIDQYTMVRAIAETNDGALHMTTRFVKASGGCSAPPAADALAARAALGRMRLRMQPGETPPGPIAALLTISHPNDSGLVMDQTTRLYTPAHFVRTVAIRYGDRPVLDADLDFAISENPHLRFHFLAGGGPAELRVDVIDSQDRRFEHSVTWPAP